MALQSTVNLPGYVATSNPTTTPVRGTIYIEPSANAQRSIASSSANDTAAGTGARKVRIRYFPLALTGPMKEEVVTLNGITPVNTVATDICYIERITVEDVGSLGGNAGTITLFAGLAGAGGIVGSIAPGDNQTNWCHHYVSAGYTAFVTIIQGGNKGTSGGAITMRATPITAPARAELTVAPQLRVSPGVSASFGFDIVPLAVAGPARITLYAQQDAPQGTNTWFAGFGYYEN
ncbi:MAG: hypothetical protein ACREJC_06550 [Tepidisphaeraceae bacterium]